MSPIMVDRTARTRARMLRTEDVAKRLDIPIRRVRILAQQGIIPRVKIGHSIRFNEADLEAWIAAGGAGYPKATK